MSVHADHTARTKVLLQHWKSVCSNVAFVPHGKEDRKDRACPAMWADPAVCEVLIDAGADIETKDDMGRSPLHWACRSGTLEVVKMLHKQGAGVCVTCNSGNTCLIFAANNGHTETVRYLVGLKDVDVNHTAKNGWSALVCAVRQKHADVVQVLIDAGADIEARDKSSRTPLISSCEKGELPIVKMLVEAGAKVRATDKKGGTCLIMAANFGHTETVRYLVGLPDMDVVMSIKDKDGYTAVLVVADLGHADVMKVLIDAGADIETKDDMGRSPLHRACCSGTLEVVKMLHKQGAGVCVTCKGYTGLIFAAFNGHTETVRYLVGLKDVDVNHTANDGWSALGCAVRQKHADVVQVLIDAGADIEARDSNARPLISACEKGELRIVKMLVEAGAEVRATDKQGRTCLMMAATFGHTETVRYLVGLPDMDVVMSTKAEEGNTAVLADIETKNNAGQSALSVASMSGKLEVVKVLVRAGAKVCVTDNNGNTCLTLAAAGRHTETVRTLLCMPGVDVNHSSSLGFTALLHAVLNEDSILVQVLIGAGADIEVNEQSGFTPPLHTACEIGELTIVQMLVEAGADVRVVDDNGSTCLHGAAFHGHTETVRYLVGLKDMDVNHTANDGWTALGCALREYHTDVVQVLIDAGADLRDNPAA